AADARSRIAATSAAVSAPQASRWVCASTTDAGNRSGTGGGVSRSFFRLITPPECTRVHAPEGPMVALSAAMGPSVAFNVVASTSALYRCPLRTRLAQLRVELGEQRRRLRQRTAHLDRLRLPRSEEHTSELQSRENLVCR